MTGIGEDGETLTLVVDHPPESAAPDEVFATVSGQRHAYALEFIRRDGSSFTVPYSHAPLTWWTPPGSLIVEYPGLFSVMIRGKRLGELKRRINDRRVIWVRECDSELAASLPSAVTAISILLAFPSHEGGGSALS